MGSIHFAGILRALFIMCFVQSSAQASGEIRELSAFELARVKKQLSSFVGMYARRLGEGREETMLITTEGGRFQTYRALNGLNFGQMSADFSEVRMEDGGVVIEQAENISWRRRKVHKYGFEREDAVLWLFRSHREYKWSIVLGRWLAQHLPGEPAERFIRLSGKPMRVNEFIEMLRPPQPLRPSAEIISFRKCNERLKFNDGLIDESR